MGPHPCQQGPWVGEVNSGPQTNQLQRPGCQGVPGTLRLFLREPGPLPAILGALKSERERKSMYVPCGLLGRLLESGCEGHLRPPHWFCGLSQGFATWLVGTRMPRGTGSPRSRRVALTLPLVNQGHGAGDIQQDRQSLVVVELLVLVVVGSEDH